MCRGPPQNSAYKRVPKAPTVPRPVCCSLGWGGGGLPGTQKRAQPIEGPHSGWGEACAEALHKIVPADRGLEAPTMLGQVYDSLGRGRGVWPTQDS